MPPIRGLGDGLRARISAYDWETYRQLFTPKLVTCLARGYNLDDFRHDVAAGLTVAILALPLSMAIAIGAGASPDKGLITAVIAGFLISALGGSRYQIGGPAAAFIVIVAAVGAEHGATGLMTATFRRLHPRRCRAPAARHLHQVHPRTGDPRLHQRYRHRHRTGAGEDFLGLQGSVPNELFARIAALVALRDTFNPAAAIIGLATLASIIALRRWLPRWPGFLIAVAAASGVVWLLGLEVETIGSRFGGIPEALPAPALPDLSWRWSRRCCPRPSPSPS